MRINIGLQSDSNYFKININISYVSKFEIYSKLPRLKLISEYLNSTFPYKVL